MRQGPKAARTPLHLALCALLCLLLCVALAVIVQLLGGTGS
jgi:hypothetical protein